jgi:hypothetical protein
MIIYLYTFSPLPPQLVEVEQGRVIIKLFIKKKGKNKEQALAKKGGYSICTNKY